MLDLDQLLRQAVERGASDVHIKVGSPPYIRVDGRLERTEHSRQVSLLEDRGSDAFLPTSIQLFGTVDDDLLDLAESLLTRIRARWATTGRCWSAGKNAARLSARPRASG